MQARSSFALAAVVGFAVAVPVAGAAKPAPKPVPKPVPGASAITLDVKPSILVFAQTTTLSGRLSGATASGVPLQLEADSVPPLGDKYTFTGKTTTTATNGMYKFVVAPGVNTLYRVVAKSTPPVTSPVRTVRVRPQVGLTTSTNFPRRGSLVTFSGSVRPVHNGLLVSIQRRTSTGGWATVTKTSLKAATVGRSTYRRAVRVRASGVYRVILPAHDDNITGISRSRALTVR